MAEPRMKRTPKILLIALASVLAVGVAAGAVIAGVVESERSSASPARTPHAAARPTSGSGSSVTTSTAAPQPTATPPSTVATSDPVPEAQVILRESPQATPLSAPVAPVAPVPAQPLRQQLICPSGTVTAALDSVSFEWPYETLVQEVAIIGRGTLHNGTSAAIQIMERDVPNLDGLNSKGQNSTIELYGEYDWAPPPGVPSGGYVTLVPGESVTYIVEDRTLASMIAPVTHWYSATELGSVQMYYKDADSRCNITGMAEGSGKAIPNTFMPRS